MSKLSIAERQELVKAEKGVYKCYNTPESEIVEYYDDNGVRRKLNLREYVESQSGLIQGGDLDEE